MTNLSMTFRKINIFGRETAIKTNYIFTKEKVATKLQKNYIQESYLFLKIVFHLISKNTINIIHFWYSNKHYGLKNKTYYLKV